MGFGVVRASNFHSKLKKNDADDSDDKAILDPASNERQFDSSSLFNGDGDDNEDTRTHLTVERGGESGS